MQRLRPYFPKSRGRARVDDRRVLSGIIFINRNGLRWCDAPAEYGPPKTLYNRWRTGCEVDISALCKMGGFGLGKRDYGWARWHRKSCGRPKC